MKAWTAAFSKRLRTPKNSLKVAILDARDGLKPKIAELVTKLCNDGNWTAGNIRATKSKNGEVKCYLSFAQVKRVNGVSDEKIAASLGISVAEVAAIRERQEKAMASNAIDVSSSKADEQAAAELEAEEKARQAVSA